MTAPAAPRLGARDNLRFAVSQTVPQLLRGMFVPRAPWASFFARRQHDAQGIEFVRELRTRYGSDYLWVNMAGKPSLLVLDVEGVRHVLDASPEVYGPPDIKVRGMAHFQPDALTVSVGEAWRRRRVFHDEVFDAGRAVHGRAEEFLVAVDRRVGGVLPEGEGRLGWAELHGAFRGIAGDVVFGPDVDAEPVLALLDPLVVRANGLFGKVDELGLAALMAAVGERVCADGAGGLSVAVCPHAGGGAQVGGGALDAVGQVPHWLFALTNSVPAACAYALALLASHPRAQEAARSEVARQGAGSPDEVAGLAYVQGCLREGMRLWPTTPMIARKALRDDEIRGHAVQSGAQVVIHNGFNHRHPELVVAPDSFRPERWEPGVWDYQFNPMSNGPQACAARELVLFLGTAVLSRALRAHRWRLVDPVLEPDRPIPQAFDLEAMLLLAEPA